MYSRALLTYALFIMMFIGTQYFNVKLTINSLNLNKNSFKKTKITKYLDTISSKYTENKAPRNISSNL